jgi:anion-transporting  ArsA/GET3 family ATPase
MTIGVPPSAPADEGRAAHPSNDPIARLVMSHRVVVAAGAGGVGKTTTAAAMALLAAVRGKRVLCLTIDPARRLAQALGLDKGSSDEQVVSLESLSRDGIKVDGSLSAMMLDAKTTFDELIVKYSSSPERARHLLDNKLYKLTSTSLAGTREYMAMEKLEELRQSDRFDVIVLDTPPTRNAIDFLDAPDRLVGAIDSSAVRWLAQALSSTGKLTLSFLARSAAFVLRGLARITGRGFLEGLAELLTELNELFGGFKDRARAIEATLRSTEVTFVLVTSPSPLSIQEALYFGDRLAVANMSRGGFVVNRVRRIPSPAGETPSREPSREEVAQTLGAHGLTGDRDLAGRIVEAYRDGQRMAALDRAHIGLLERHVGADIPVVLVPEIAGDVTNLRELWEVAESLLGL